MTLSDISQKWQNITKEDFVKNSRCARSIFARFNDRKVKFITPGSVKNAKLAAESCRVAINYSLAFSNSIKNPVFTFRPAQKPPQSNTPLNAGVENGRSFELLEIKISRSHPRKHNKTSN